VIPVLVLACDRSTVRRCLDKLLRYRPSARRFPLIVSQDCGHAETAQVIASYGEAVAHIQQPDLSDIPDDLEVAPDFFEYFQAAFPLLVADPSLWCVSAWNDNGKEHLVDAGRAELLYRTDFFPGLGWLLLAELWEELEPKWPKAFWDDWMRQPEQRRGRSCLNDRFVPFTRLDLSYLKKEEYERSFLPKVYAAPEVKVEELQSNRRRELGTVRLQYSGRDSFKAFAKALGLMDDLKSGV
ncbi:MGAT1 acetylglucosaminyltransferase, partial [Pedionomus torquatus]|nr:MGAT1 acetylglucosaminyltransferase [Pedionomus torquatus]